MPEAIVCRGGEERTDLVQRDLGGDQRGAETCAEGRSRSIEAAGARLRACRSEANPLRAAIQRQFSKSMLVERANGASPSTSVEVQAGGTQVVSYCLCYPAK